MKQIVFQPKEEVDLNDRLINLYGSRLVGLYSDLEPIIERKNGVKPALPLLLWLHDCEAYEKADIKVMIFGRETNNWNDKANRKSFPNYTYNFGLGTSEDVQYEISGIHDESHDIYGICDIYDEYQNKDEAPQTPFTKKKDIFVDMLKKAFPDKRIECIWNNVHKVGKGVAGKGNCRGVPPFEIQEIVKRRFDVVPAEIDILKPDILIFLTGKYADNAIMNTFGITKDEFVPVNASSELFLDRINIPGIKYSARTIHPSEPFKSNEYFIKHFNALIEDLANNFK